MPENPSGMEKKEEEPKNSYLPAPDSIDLSNGNWLTKRANEEPKAVKPVIAKKAPKPKKATPVS